MFTQQPAGRRLPLSVRRAARVPASGVFPPPLPPFSAPHPAELLHEKARAPDCRFRRLPRGLRGHVSVAVPRSRAGGGQLQALRGNKAVGAINPTTVATAAILSARRGGKAPPLPRLPSFAPRPAIGSRGLASFFRLGRSRRRCC